MKIYNSQNQFGQRFITAQDNDIQFQGKITLSPNTYLSDGTELDAIIDSKADETTVDALTAQVHDLNNQKADKTSVDALDTKVQTMEAQKADKTSVDTLSTQVQSLETQKADKTSVDTLNTRVQTLTEQKADKTSVDALNVQVQTINTQKADKTSVDALGTQIQNIDEQKADKTQVVEIWDALSCESTLEPSGGTTRDVSYKYVKLNGMYFPFDGTLKSISIQSRSSGDKSTGYYLMIFQRQKDNPSTDATTWEFKGISKNAPSQTEYDTFYDYNFENTVIAANRHIAFLVTTNPNQRTWVYPSGASNCKSKSRLETDNFSCMSGNPEINNIPCFKYTIVERCTGKIQEMCMGGGAVTKSQLAASMDEGDKIPTAQMIKDYIDSIIPQA